MASLKVLLVALVALLLATCASASQRQPLFADGSSAIPQRFQEMMAQRRHLTQAGRYGSPSPPAPRSPSPSPSPTARTTSPSPSPTPARYGTYGVYGR